MTIDVKTASKDELDKYGSELGLTLDLRKSIDTLRKEVLAAEQAQGLGAPEELPAPDIKWLKHKVNGRVYPFTQALLDYGLLPCDDNGKLV